MSCGRKRNIRDLQPGRQLHRCGTDRIHRDRDKLRHAGSAPRHSPDKPELLLSEAQDCEKDYGEADGADRGREEWAVEDGVVKVCCKLIANVIICIYTQEDGDWEREGKKDD